MSVTSPKKSSVAVPQLLAPQPLHYIIHLYDNNTLAWKLIHRQHHLRRFRRFRRFRPPFRRCCYQCPLLPTFLMVFRLVDCCVLYFCCCLSNFLTIPSPLAGRHCCCRHCWPFRCFLRARPCCRRSLCYRVAVAFLPAVSVLPAISGLPAFATCTRRCFHLCPSVTVFYCLFLRTPLLSPVAFGPLLSLFTLSLPPFPIAFLLLFRRKHRKHSNDPPCNHLGG